MDPKNTYNAGIEAAIHFAAVRADGLYEWMLKQDINSNLRYQLSLRCGELTELVHDLRSLIKVDA